MCREGTHNIGNKIEIKLNWKVNTISMGHVEENWISGSTLALALRVSVSECFHSRDEESSHQATPTEKWNYLLFTTAIYVDKEGNKW